MTTNPQPKLDPTRCFGTGSVVYETYHDHEWGVPVHDDHHLFELLTLEGAQAGLSWETILKRRESYRLAFDNFDIERVASYGKKEIANLLGNEGIIRNTICEGNTFKFHPLGFVDDVHSRFCECIFI